MAIGLMDLSGGKLWMMIEARIGTLPCLQLLDTALAPRTIEYPLRGGGPKEGHFSFIHSLTHMFRQPRRMGARHSQKFNFKCIY